MDDALDDAGSVVVEKPGACLPEARYELVQGLGKEIKSCGESAAGPWRWLPGRSD